MDEYLYHSNSIKFYEFINEYVASVAHVAEIDIIIQTVAKIWNRLVV